MVSEFTAFTRTDGQTDMAKSTQLVLLIKNIYILWETVSSTCYIQFTEYNIPFQSGINKKHSAFLKFLF